MLSGWTSLATYAAGRIQDTSWALSFLSIPLFRLQFLFLLDAQIGYLFFDAASASAAAAALLGDLDRCCCRSLGEI